MDVFWSEFHVDVRRRFYNNLVFYVFAGVRQRLEHLSYLGVDAVLLSSVLDSPFDNFGRDVLDFMSVNTKYGSIQEFDYLITELHARGET